MSEPSPLSLYPVHYSFSDLSRLSTSVDSTIFNISLHSHFLPLSLHFCLKFLHMSLTNHFKPRVVVRQLLIALVLCCQKRFRSNRLRAALSHLRFPSQISLHISGFLLHSRQYWLSCCLGVPCILTLNLPDSLHFTLPFTITQLRLQPLFHIAPLSLVTCRASTPLTATSSPSPLLFSIPTSELLVAHLSACFT